MPNLTISIINHIIYISNQNIIFPNHTNNIYYLLNTPFIIFLILNLPHNLLN